MCEFCTKHGEGKKWYLNAKNYSQDLLDDLGRRKFVKKHFFWLDEQYKNLFHILKKLPLSVPFFENVTKSLVKRHYMNKHWGQVIPVEDVAKIFDFVSSITRIPCGCRAVTTGKEHRTCFLISLNPGKIGLADIVDQSYFGGPDVAKFEKVEKEWTLKFFKESERRGMIHTIWAFKAPFIGGFCNCDFSSGCIPMKMYKEVVPMIFKSEYLADIDKNSCTGCKECIKICQFNALIIDKKNNRMSVNDNKCYGCGICRSVCNKNAIKLNERRESLVASKMWY